MCDRFPNGHATYVYLSISGHGTARYRSHGSNTCTDHQAPAHGKMTMQVCTSLSAKAICTKAYKFDG